MAYHPVFPYKICSSNNSNPYNNSYIMASNRHKGPEGWSPVVVHLTSSITKERSTIQNNSRALIKKRWLLLKLVVISSFSLDSLPYLRSRPSSQVSRISQSKEPNNSYNRIFLVDKVQEISNNNNRLLQMSLQLWVVQTLTCHLSSYQV